MGALKKQIAACKLAVKALTRERRRLHATGEHAWQEGHRPDVIDDPQISGVVFGFAEDDHKGYVKYSEAIQQMEDMIEALSEADAKLDEQLSLFEEADGSETSHA